MDATEKATASHGERDRKRWNGEKGSTADAWTKLCRMRRRETEGQSRTLARVQWAKLGPRTASAFAPCSPPTPCVRAFSLRPTLRAAAAAACALLGALDCRLTLSWSRSFSTSSFSAMGLFNCFHPNSFSLLLPRLFKRQRYLNQCV
jgi:hypothetical protein